MAQLSALKKFEYKEKRKLPTGIDPLDTILNNGPEEGDLICLSSKQGGGKSTMLLMLSRIYIEEYGMKVCYLDVERGVKHEIMDNMGLTKYRESGDFYITNQVNTYTDASELLEEILNSNDNYGLLVIDSITALVPTKLIEKEPESEQMALKARAMTSFIDKFRGRLANKNIVTFAIAQYRKNLKQTYNGAPEYVVAAPQALNHAADVIMHITVSGSKDRKIFRTASTTQGIEEVNVGATHYLWTEKNKHAMPFVKVDFPVIYGQEISNYEYLKNLIVNKKLYVKEGQSWYTEIGGIKKSKVNGKNALYEFIAEHMAELRQKLFEDGHYDLLNFDKVSEEDTKVAEVED